MMGVREREIEVFKDTMIRCNTEYLSETQDLVANRTKIYTEELRLNKLSLHPKMTLKVVKGGTVEIGKKILEETEGKRTAILNFADAIRPGGWVIDGAPTQEENICRCSNLYPVLISEGPLKKYYWINENNKYPKANNLYGEEVPFKEGTKWEDFSPDHAVYTHRLIYNRDVLFFKDDTTYELVEPYHMDVITCPAPAVFWKDNEFARELIAERIEQIINCAIDNNVRNLVLGAWGCGAFGQDPDIVSKAFMDILSQKKYQVFWNVIFAIRCTADYWRDDNFTAFERNCKLEE